MFARDITAVVAGFVGALYSPEDDYEQVNGMYVPATEWRGHMRVQAI
jgi:hypothetical protein